MSYIILGVVLLVVLGLASEFRKYIVGQIFLFAIIVAVVVQLFSGFIPFSAFLINLSTCVIVGCILFAAYMWIFKGRVG